MLNITGPIQSNLQPIQDNIEQFLKVNQRIAGEVLHVSNEQVVLAVNGVQIVAKMTSSEQLAMLMDRRYAFFVVKDISNSQVTLQLINNPQTNTAVQKPAISSTSIGQAILEQLGIKVDQSNLTIVQSALDQGLKVTPELLNEIKQVLEPLSKWGSKDAQLAAAIKSAGLPLSTGSLKLAQNAVKEIKTHFLAVYEQLEVEISRPGISQQAYQSLRNVQIALKDAIIQGNSTIENIEQNIFGSIRNLGSSLENNIGKVVQPGFENEIAKALQPGIKNGLTKPIQLEGQELQNSKMSGVLFTLANLRHELGPANSGRLTTAIDNFIEGMRWMHFVNAEPDHPLPKGQWTQLDLPITFSFQTVNHLQRNLVHDLQIRVAHDNDEQTANSINPDYTRLVIQVDLDQEEMIKVDLSIVANLIGAEITASSETICLRASEELDEFQTGLSNLGFTLKTSKVELGGSKLELGISEPDRIGRTISSVDLGV
jgi:hypothetical protein